jgi:uncharacterized OB-fold protein
MPNPTPTTEPFWQGLKQKRVLLQQCDECDKWIFYPRSNCPGCLSGDISWREVSGEGEVYSFTIARRPTAPQFAGLEPQLIAVIELKEGVRMNSVVVNVGEQTLAVGLKVKPFFESGLGDQTLLYFEPA